MPWNYALAFVMLIAGAMLVACGSTVCWRRLSCWRCKSVEEIRREDSDARRPKPDAASGAPPSRERRAGR